MSRSGFAYAHARLHARLADRFSETDWQYLENSRDLGHCLEVIGRTPAAGLISHLTKDSDIHMIERQLRQAWGELVLEISAWVPADWRDSVRWMNLLPHLRMVEFQGSLEKQPEWITPVTGPASQWLQNQPLPTSGKSVSEFWLHQLEHLVPDKSAFLELRLAMGQLFRRYLVYTDGTAHSIDKQEQAVLDRGLKKLFREKGQTPVAIFAFLGIAALDFERFRGELTVKSLFSELQKAGAG